MHGYGKQCSYTNEKIQNIHLDNNKLNDNDSASKEAYKSSFFPQTIRDWNDLPDSLLSSAEMPDDCVSKFASLVRARD